ncbi:CRISPR-associated protein Cas4 [Faecalibacterium sp. An192]|uniref:CRISPR-associated protein Cas4 n=1 Tax=Faecalibacterium sp. An192 TaxID=1965581 RepID=UPI000B39E8F0|nr:CRISPR-associated protein Cas4 [Faecalibacterium sp. An192]OUP28262.1 CRISPR-associated protein Cas4 [Faecalibacterium sp. An192]
MDTDGYLMMSGIQHFSFCRRQWALIHLEQQWAENLQTTEGQLLHQRCHDETFHEKRGNLLVVRGMRVVSHRLKMTGTCDVVEFHADPEGIALEGYPGLWLPVPVEYKHGSPKINDADRLQLCAQAMALEEMLVCTIPQAFLFYAETRRRETVELTPELRQKAQSMAEEMSRLFARGYTPKVKPGKHCNACSLKELCLPVLCRRADAAGYVRTYLLESEGEIPCESC